MTEPDPGHQRYPHHSVGNHSGAGTENKLTEHSDEEDDFRDSEVNSSERFMKKDPKTRTTIRNLRIREDTAKYLRNLDPKSAFYDPKSRSMRENPHPDKNPEEVGFAGDNFVRDTGDVTEFNKIRKFAWEAEGQGLDGIHLQAAPSIVELMFQKDKKEKQEKRAEIKQKILEQYGGEEHLNTLPKELLIAQTEHYVEYSQDGKIVQGTVKVIPKSKYPEDVFINNHTSVWGSYWVDAKWGYACCKQTLKNSYCIGDSQMQAGRIPEGPKVPKGSEQAQNSTVSNGSNKKKENVAEQKEDDSSSSEGPSKKRKGKKSKKKKKEKSKKRKRDELDDDRLRAFNSLSKDHSEVTDEQMEEYRQKRIKWNDPMRDYLTNDVTVK
eukprot:TRINITY_DN1988_c0_g1_i1.p1 TRINITY_DN1988_c0_g1~~TRINITY_DN1988_c0_g1_i1.p1  ORF type:complete len:380 (-),score=93.09 TRINITY_DN1988_c0_g1_i1:56-1195(-)